MAVKICNSSAIGNGNGCFVDSSGHIHVVVYASRGSSSALLYAVSTDGGATFTNGEGGASGTTKQIATAYYPNSQPAVVVDTSGNVYVFYTDNDAKVYIVKKVSGTWGAGAYITPSANHFMVMRAEIDDDNNLIIFGEHFYNISNHYYSVYTSYDGGANWVENLDASTDVTNSTLQIDLTLGYNQHLYAIWTTGSKLRTMKITKTEGAPDTWSVGAFDLDDSDTYLYSAIICERDSETLWAFRTFKTGSDYQLQYKKKSGGTWGSWTTIVSNVTAAYQNLQVIRTYTNKIMLIYEINGTKTLNYVFWDGGVWSAQTTCLANAELCNIQQPNIPQSTTRIFFAYKKGDANEFYVDSVQVPIPQVLDGDTLTLSDEIYLNLSREKEILTDSLILSDDIHVARLRKQESDDTLTLSDELRIKQVLKQSLTDSLSLSDEIFLQLQETNDLINDFRMSKLAQYDAENKFSFAKRALSNVVNVILTARSTVENILSKINTKKQAFYNIKNDVRIIADFMIPGEAGPQSLGKEYIKVYIDSVEQTDVDVDTVSITRSLNSAAIASFELARAYDTTKPDIEATVEIYYHIWKLFSGYITQIAPSDNPERMTIQCQDNYWKDNRDSKVYFNVGHKPTDDTEVYYNTINEGLSSGCGVSFGIGSFVPQTIGCFGLGKAEAITSLVNQAGNFSLFYNIAGTPKLWSAGAGDIINIERQEIGKNIGLYQLLSHQIRDDIENVVNQYRVQMGQKVIRRFNSSGGTKKYTSYEYRSVQANATPSWNVAYEIIARSSGSGYGFDYHKPEENNLYQDVFRKYALPFLDKELEEWSDRHEPEVHINLPFGGMWKCSIPIATVSKFGFEDSQPIRDGFTIDYDNQTLVFNQPLYLYQTNEAGELTAVRAPEVRLWLWKKKYYSDTESPSQNPQTDIANPLMFFTAVMGSYPTTIQENLNLTNLSIQVGGYYYDNEGYLRIVPSWDDTAFASDYANWLLSQKCDKKISGTIDITLDALCFYGIELDKRIMINNVLESALNIQSISINVSSFTASLTLQNGRYYARSVSLQSRGE